MEKILFKVFRRLILKFRFYNKNWKRRIFKKFFANKYFKKNNNNLGTNVLKYGFFKIPDDDIKKNIFYSEVLEGSNYIINQKNQTEGTKNYLRNILVHPDEKKIKIFLNFFLDSKFMEIVENYLEDLPLMTELKLLHSPANIQETHSGSQLYHRDFDDEKIVKFFLYLVDVDENTGPLEIINNIKSKEVTSKLKSAYSIHSDNKVEEFVDENKDRINLLGKRGDCFLVDTSSCFHRGSRKSLKDRYVLYANFSTRSSFRFPPIFKYSKDQEIINFHSPLSRYIHLLDENKRKYLINNI